MARPKSLAKMSIEALLELRESIGATLTERAADLQKQLSRLSGTDVGNGARRGRPGRPRALPRSLRPRDVLAGSRFTFAREAIGSTR
jgi:hypothetical protein